MKIEWNNLPQHIAIIMDGNGRWAKQHTIGRIRGHKKGAQAVRATVRACREIGIKYLTLFAFSIENWGRPEEEVKALMSLLEEYLTKETKTGDVVVFMSSGGLRFANLIEGVVNSFK